MNASQTVKRSFSKGYDLVKSRKDILYVIVFVLALIAFEAFNYSTAEYALVDLLGELTFAGVPWATLLAIAFCGIDFAGITLLLTSNRSTRENRSVWFMFGAWILAATMNATLTWWGIVLAIQTHIMMRARVVNNTFVTNSLPVFIALMVWLIRILLIGSLSKNEDEQKQLENINETPLMSRRELRQAQSLAAHPEQNHKRNPFVGANAASFSQKQNTKRGYKPEPTYIPMQEEALFYNQRRELH